MGLENTPVTKNEIIDSLTQDKRFTVDMARHAVNHVFTRLSEACLTERGYEIRDFATAKVRVAKARQAKNPKTGENVHVPARKQIKMKPSKTLQGALKPVTTAS